MAEPDFEFMTKLEPEGCFVLWQDQERVGMATCINYGRTGWFGNLVVKKDYRGKSAGTFLLKHAVKYLKNKGVETIGLYAYQHLVGFYQSAGFKPHDELLILTGKPINATGKRLNVVEASENDLPMLIGFDQQFLSWNRKKLFEEIMREEEKLCYVSELNGEIAGFAMAKVYDEIAEVGPLICDPGQPHLAIKLVEAILGTLRKSEIYAYVNSINEFILETIMKAGLKQSFRLTRMFLGPFLAQDCVYMPESLERG